MTDARFLSLVRMLLLAATSASCAAVDSTPSHPCPAADEETYRVYDAILSHRFAMESMVVLEKYTGFVVPPSSWASPMEHLTIPDLHLISQSLPLVDEAIRESLAARERVPSTLDDAAFQGGLPRVVLGLDEVAELSKASDQGSPGVAYPLLSGRYPGAKGFTILSGVGLSSTCDGALVYLGYRCGGLCGSGVLYQLKKGTSGWTVLGTMQLWVS